MCYLHKSSSSLVPWPAHVEKECESATPKLQADNIIYSIVSNNKLKNKSTSSYIWFMREGRCFKAAVASALTGGRCEFRNIDERLPIPPIFSRRRWPSIEWILGQGACKGQQNASYTNGMPGRLHAVVSFKIVVYEKHY